MSHPDPLFDSENVYEDDFELPETDPNYDDSNDFYMEDYNGDDSFDDSMDGDAESAFGSCGWGVDEYYNADTDYGDDDREDFHADEAVGFVDYNEDGPYED